MEPKHGAGSVPVKDNLALGDTNAAVHALCEDRVYAVLEALVQRELGVARERWRDFVKLLTEHMAFEDEHIVPAYAPIAPTDGPGRLDHIAGDHTILLRHVTIIDEALAALAASPAPSGPSSLRPILEELPKLYRLLGTLEHHTAREQAYLYPGLVAALPPAAQTALARRLAAVLPG